MDIVKDYEHLGSLRAVAAKNDISESKVKKIDFTWCVPHRIRR